MIDPDPVFDESTMVECLAASIDMIIPEDRDSTAFYRVKPLNEFNAFYGSVYINKVMWPFGQMLSKLLRANILEPTSFWNRPLTAKKCRQAIENINILEFH